MAAGSILIDLLLKTGAFETDIKKAEKRWDNFTKSIVKGAGAIGAAFSVFKGVELADGYTQMASRIKNATESMGEYNQVQQRLEANAKITFRALGESQEGFLAYATSMRAIGYSTEQVLDLTDSLSFSFTANAARADQAQSAQDALAKSMARGKVDAMAWMSILTAADNVAGQIAKTMGITEAEVRKLGASGKLGLNDLIQGLIAAKEENQGLAEAMDTSLNDGLTNLTNSITIFLGKLNIATGATNSASGGLGVLADNIDLVADSIVVLSGIYLGRFAGAQAVVIAQKYKDIAASYQAVAAAHAEAKAKGILAASTVSVAKTSSMALAALGGWVGLAVTLSTVAAGFFLVSKASDKTLESTEKQKKSIRELANEYIRMNDAQKSIRLMELRKELAAAQGDLDDFLKGRFTGSGEAIPIFDKFKEELGDVGEFINDIHKLDIYTPEQLSRIQDHANKLKELAGKVTSVKDETKLLTDRNLQLANGATSAADGINKQTSAMAGLKNRTEETIKAFDKFQESQKANSDSLALQVELLKKGYSFKQTEDLNKYAAAFGYDKSQFSAEEMAKVAAQSKIDEANQKQLDAIKKEREEREKLANDITRLNKVELAAMQRVQEQARKYNYASLEEKYGLPKNILAALSMQESRGNSNAVSPVGARGAFQFMPSTAKAFEVDVKDIGSSAEGAAKYLNKLLKMFNGNLELAVNAYNWGEGRVQKYLKGDIKNKPAETQGHWAGVSKYRSHLGGDEFVDVFAKELELARDYALALQDVALQAKALDQSTSNLQLFGFDAQITPLKEFDQELGKLDNKYAKFGEKGTEELRKQYELLTKKQNLLAIEQFSTESSSYLKDLAFENELIGKTTKAIEQLRYERALDAQAKALSIGMDKEELAVLEKKVAELKKLYKDIEAEATKKGGSWQDGVMDGLSKFAEDAGNLRKQFADATENMMNNLSDTLGEFVVTGKFKFKDFATSVIQDLTRIAMKMAVANMFSGIFGGSSNASSVLSGSTGPLWADGGYTGSGGKYEPAGIVHRGEVVFSQADVKRFGGVDKVEAMRLRGYANGGVVGGGASRIDSGMTVNIHNNAPVEVETKQGVDGAGLPILDIIIRETKNALIKDVGTNGAFSRTMQGGFGLKRTAK